MEHLAIMKKSLGYLDKILSGEKTIESRWYTTRRSPWDNIKKEEKIYFKNSSCDVHVQAKTEKVFQFSDLTPNKIHKILQEYGKEMGISNKNTFFEVVKNKKYCILIFLKEVQEIRPFKIDKKGYGNMSAWISIKNIEEIRVSNH